MKPPSTLFIALMMFLPLAHSEAQAYHVQKDDDAYPTGLSLSVDAGLLMADRKSAAFYSGREDTPNRLYRILHSEQYGPQIWSDLATNESNFFVPSYSALKVEEWATMDYKLAYQLGVALRYGYRYGWGWRLGFDFAQLNATGQFLISKGAQIPGSDQYVVCGVYGTEKRILIDLALTKRFNLTKRIGMEVDLGFDLNNTKVAKNAIVVEGKEYSILDIWNGESPYQGAGTYEYVNQGGIGIGGFGSLLFSYQLENFSIDLGYTCYYTQTRFPGYNDGDAYAFQHLVSLRFNLYRFKFL